MTGDATPLCVDLDGTITKNDLFFASLRRLLKQQPLRGCLLLLTYLFKGRAALKAQVNAQSPAQSSDLCLHPELLDFLKKQYQAGRNVMLVTGNDRATARFVADTIGIFTDIMASDGVTNLTGHVKANALVSRFGMHGFDYVGNSYCDIPVWRQARKIYVVSNNQRLINKVRRLKKIEGIFEWKIAI